jgi:hypothetical protein
VVLGLTSQPILLPRHLRIIVFKAVLHSRKFPIPTPIFCRGTRIALQIRRGCPPVEGPCKRCKTCGVPECLSRYFTGPACQAQSPYGPRTGCRTLVTPLSFVIPARSVNPCVSEWVEGLQTALSSAKSNLASAQQRQKTYADKRRRDHPFQVGDQVLLAARKNQLAPGLSSKLSAKYFGPFEIVAAVGTRAFKLNLPETVNIHRVFMSLSSSHMSLLLLLCL